MIMISPVDYPKQVYHPLRIIFHRQHGKLKLDECHRLLSFVLVEENQQNWLIHVQITLVNYVSNVLTIC